MLVNKLVKSILPGLIILALIPSTVFAEYVIGNDDGVITADEIREYYKLNKEWLDVETPKIADLDERERSRRTAEGWLDHLAPYVALANANTTDEVKQHIFFPDENTCLSHVNDFYLASFKQTGQCSRKEWFLKERGASFYYIISNSVAALFHVVDDKLSLALVIEAQGGANYNFEPKFYHRVVNGENLLLLHLHGVISGNGAWDDENLLVVNNDQTLSVVNTKEMYNQLASHLKDKYAINRAHSFLTEESFTYWASTRSQTESPYIAAQFKLTKSEKSGEYHLELDPSTLQKDSAKLNALGLRKYREGLYDEAAELFRKAIQQTPTQYGHLNFGAYSNLGLALLKAGNISESIQASEMVFNHPEAGSIHKGNAAFNLGIAYEKTNNLIEAERYYLQAFNIDRTETRQRAYEKVKAKVAIIEEKEKAKLAALEEEKKAKRKEDFERKKQAAQNDVGLQYEIGMTYHDSQNYSEAIVWLSKAAMNGHVEAQFVLAQMYDGARGVKQDYSKAAEWYDKAAAQGHAHAQHRLGSMLTVGQGVNQDLHKAKLLFKKAADQGDPYAKQAYESLRSID